MYQAVCLCPRVDLGDELTINENGDMAGSVGNQAGDKLTIACFGRFATVAAQRLQ